jgi:glycerophosphoryl diester phosphodiesterase
MIGPVVLPPEVVAHRGASEDVAEHTLAAYEKAIADGADALECDVRLTADGHLVCVHDRRINRTSDGRGVVSTKTRADLYSQDFASWKQSDGLEGDALDSDGTGDSRRRVLTLERLLQLVVDCGRDVGLAIEAKHPTRYAGQVEDSLAKSLRRFGVDRPPAPEESRVRVMSFSQLSVRRMRVLSPRVPTVFLMERVPMRFRDGSLPFDAAIAGPSIEIIRAHPGYVAKAHSVGHPVHVWTVDEPADVTLCQELGVDAIITNRPRQVHDQILTTFGQDLMAVRQNSQAAQPAATTRISRH